MAAHELQKPLKSLEEGLESLKKHHTTKDTKTNAQATSTLTESIGMLENSIDRLKTLVAGYLDYAFIQIDAASFEPIHMPILLEEALNNIADIRDKHKANITYDKNSFASCPSLLGNSQMLCSVFQELISNSIRYCDKPERQVEIAYETQPGLCLFSIKDNGQGIHPKFFEQIFWVIKPDLASGCYKRNSIGLAISKKVIEHHGGKIWVSSNVEGHGSTFYISLPIPAQH